MHMLLPDCPISIHAPARGATRFLIWRRAALSNFNPRSRKGSDVHSSTPLSNDTEFQSTLPQGERRHPQFGQAGALSISIHAPARGATFSGHQKASNQKHFNPRSRKGSDFPTLSIFLQFLAFQSTLPQGERQVIIFKC